MQFAARVSNGIDEHSDIFRRRELRNSVSQIEDVPACIAEILQNFFCLSPNRISAAE